MVFDLAKPAWRDPLRWTQPMLEVKTGLQRPWNDDCFYANQEEAIARPLSKPPFAVRVPRCSSAGVRSVPEK